MCLIRIDERYDPPIEVEAWKIFSQSPEGRLSSPFFSHRTNWPFERYHYIEGEWHEAESDSKIAVTTATTIDGRTFFEREFYPAGFHAFATEEDAKNDIAAAQKVLAGPLVVRRVKLQGVHTKGGDGLLRDPIPAYVAQRMLIPPETDARKSKAEVQA